MHPESEAFHAKLAEDKRIGREACHNCISTQGYEAAKNQASAAVLKPEIARENYGFWSGWIDAVLQYQGK